MEFSKAEGLEREDKPTGFAMGHDWKFDSLMSNHPSGNPAKPLELEGNLDEMDTESSVSAPFVEGKIKTLMEKWLKLLYSLISFNAQLLLYYFLLNGSSKKF
jgi:hypothetical protein